MLRNYTLNLEKILTAYTALRDFYNAPADNDEGELDILWRMKTSLNIDELDVYYTLVQSIYMQGRNDGYRAALDDEDIDG